MPSPCPACLKLNPEYANYCYYDGRPLSKDLAAGPVHVGAQPFPIPFCFPDGQACANFNQLALACDERWDEAKSLLAQGYWPTYFGSIGRLDLSAVAQRAAQEPDRDLGLSQLLEKFPADPEALRPPKLAIEPAEKSMGVLSPGTDQTFELIIINQGMLVLRGMVVSNSEWLVFGDRNGPKQKMFQTRNMFTIKVRALGGKLRAGLKPLQGEIVVDTNGGTITLPVKAEVPICPFPKGVYANDALAGARSPHEIALRAKQFPKEAGILFQEGAVKAWYAANGWMYPIEGSEGFGKGAVQQFFEALGLAKPPHLDIDTKSLTLRGKIGEKILRRVTLGTEEAKPVFVAQAFSSQPWVTVGAINPQGNKIKIPIEIIVPPFPGQIVEAKVTIQGNGKQRFDIPISLAIADAPPVHEVIPVEVIEEPQSFPDNVVKSVQSFFRNLFGQ